MREPSRRYRIPHAGQADLAASGLGPPRAADNLSPRGLRCRSRSSSPSAGRAAFEPVDVAIAVDIEAADHTEVADAGNIRASGAGWFLDRAEHPAQFGEPVGHAAGVEPFPGH